MALLLNLYWHGAVLRVWELKVREISVVETLCCGNSIASAQRFARADLLR